MSPDHEPDFETYVNAGCGLIGASDLGGGRYRIEEGRAVHLEEVSLGDIVEAVKVEGESYPKFVRVVERGQFMVRPLLVVHRKFVETPSFKAFSEDLLAVGGDWELIFGALLTFWVPRASDFVLGPKWLALWGDNGPPAFDDEEYREDWDQKIEDER